MSPSLANHIEEFKRSHYQATQDANLAKSMKQAEPFRAGGRPKLVDYDNRMADKLVQDAIENTGSNYDD